jgi:hypothetical protein
MLQLVKIINSDKNKVYVVHSAQNYEPINKDIKIYKKSYNSIFHKRKQQINQHVSCQSSEPTLS